MAVRIRGIYATALTALLDDVVQPSAAIAERVEGELPHAPAAARVETTADRQAVSVHGDPERVEAVAETLGEVGLDALSWSASLPAGAVYAGEVTGTTRGGALVDVGDGTGFLPYSAIERHVEAGDRLRVQVAQPRPPWIEERPVLATDVRVEHGLLTVVRGGSAAGGGPELADVLPVEPPEGWRASWASAADDADLDALSEALAAAGDAAEAIDDALAAGGAPPEAAPTRYWAGDATTWVWFGRDSRFALDGIRREVAETMPGHHRIKAGAAGASAAVDFVEAVGAPSESAGGDGDFPFAATTRQFGPAVGDRVAIGHGKPDGSRIDLGPGEVTARDPEGAVTVEREMSPGGTYDGLGVERRAGDVAVTEFTEGRWWYPTVYRSAEGERRGTYVNVCTPVEVFPETVRYVDLHVDVVRHGDGSVERLDDDELAAAEEEGHLSPDLAERARTVADAVESAISSD